MVLLLDFFFNKRKTDDITRRHNNIMGDYYIKNKAIYFKLDTSGQINYKLVRIQYEKQLVSGTLFASELLNADHLFLTFEKIPCI